MLNFDSPAHSFFFRVHNFPNPPSIKIRAEFLAKLCLNISSTTYIIKCCHCILPHVIFHHSLVSYTFNTALTTLYLDLPSVGNLLVQPKRGPNGINTRGRSCLNIWMYSTNIMKYHCGRLKFLTCCFSLESSFKKVAWLLLTCRLLTIQSIYSLSYVSWFHFINYFRFHYWFVWSYFIEEKYSKHSYPFEGQFLL